MTVLDFIVLGVICFFIGFLVKYVDFIEDELKGSKRALLFKKISPFMGLAYGVLILLVIIVFPVLIPLAIGVILGEIVAKKIDAPGHLIAITAFVLVGVGLVFFGSLSLYTGVLIWSTTMFVALSVLFLLASLSDEFVDKYAENKKLPKIVSTGLSFRPVLEITAFIVSLVFSQWFIWVTIFSFDLAYVSFTKILPKIFSKK